MFRHVIAPARFFSQVPNEIIRHPRLSSDAVRLLAWQLSLPDGADEALSKSARRAGIKRTAFQKAKRLLLGEGYLHEWRRQGEGGRWQTVQLVSNVALTPEEARAAWQGDNGPSPAATSPAAGEPAGRSVGRQPRRKTGKKTSHPPVLPVADALVADDADDADDPPTEHTPAAAEAEALLLSLPRTEPRLTPMTRRKAAKWAPLAARWLDRGLSYEQIRETLISGLDTARSPLGVLLWRLKNCLPEVQSPPPPPTAAPRVAGMRECTGRGHAYPRLFAPRADEPECRVCSADGDGIGDGESGPPPRAEGPGFRAYLSARRGEVPTPVPAPADSA
jgi:hypothetical protein